MRLSWGVLGIAGLLGCMAGSSSSSSSGNASSSSSGSHASSTGSSSSSSSGGGTHGKVGDACQTSADCTELDGMNCYAHVADPFSGDVIADFPGGFCSKGCPNGDECGMVYSCATLSHAGGMSSAMLAICVPPCTGVDQCRASEGYNCKNFFGFGYCAPP